MYIITSVRKFPNLLLSMFLVASLLSPIIFAVSYSPSVVTWEKLYGGALDDEAAGILEADDGGFVISGTTRSFGAGGADFWLFKIDADGNVAWNRTYGGPEADETTAMIRTNDGGYALAGETSSYGAGESDFWLIKVDSSGNMQWNRTYGESTSDGANSVIQTSDGGYALAGYSTDNNASADVWFVKTGSSGNMQWNRTYGGAGSDVANSVVQTSDGGYALAGRSSSFGDSTYNNYCWLIKTDYEGNMEWNKIYKDRVENSKKFEAETLVQTGDGEYTFAATTGYIIGIVDIWLAHVDSEGNMEWNTTCVYGGPAIASSMIQTNDGGYAVSGYTSSLGNYPGTYSYMHLVKVDSNGTNQWVRNYEGLGDNHHVFVAQTSDGGFALAGTTQSRDQGAQNEVWFAKADATGESIPEFPSWAILPLTMVGALIMTMMKRRSLCGKKS